MTNKQHFNSIVRKAQTLNRRLRELSAKAYALAEECKEHADDYSFIEYNFELALLDETLEDLASFDLEDAIPEEHTKEY